MSARVQPPGGPPLDGPTLQLHVKLIPPSILTDSNQEQDFSIYMHPTQLQHLPNGQFAAAANVSFNDVRVQQFNAQLQPVAFDAKGEKIAAIAKKIKVPVVLHHEPFHVSLTAIQIDTQKKLWTMTIPCHLPADVFPRADMASTCTRVLAPEPAPAAAAPSSYIHATCNISAEQMYAEKIEFTGPEIPLCVSGACTFGRFYSAFTVQMLLQHVRNAVSKEPMTIFHGDRVWAMRKFALIADKEVFQA